MKKITIINSKGGVGKTTLALNLGLFLSQNHAQISFLDLDPQQSLSDWIKRRPQALRQFYCEKSNCQKLNDKTFSAMDEEGICVIDTPASIESEQITKLLDYSDALIIPLSPSPLDLGALTRFIFQLAANDEDILNDKPIALVANRSKTYTLVQKDILKRIEKIHLPLIATFRDTQNYTLPATRGMGLIDLPTYKIKQDLENWQPLIKWLSDNVII